MSYDKNTDYQALINQAVASGDYASAAQYEQKRNEKIADLDATGTNKYNASATNNYSQYLGGGAGYGSSGGSNANPYAGTNFHQDANDYALKYASSGNYDDWQAVLDALAARGEKISATGNDYGITNAEILESLLGYQMAGDNRYYQNQAMQMLQQLQMQTPSFSGSWGDRMSEKLLKQAIAMNYEDWTQSDQYKTLADRYGIQGEMTMQDVLGQISSRTGGLASSYAATAAQQQYNDYMAQLEEVARQMFAGERSDVIENAQLAREYGQQEYQRYLDQLNLQNNRNSTALGIINQMMGYTSDQLNNKYAQDQNSKAEAQDRINAYLAAYGNLADLDPTLIETSGYTTAELNALEKLYAGQDTGAAAPQSTGSSSGGGGGGPDYEGLFSAAQASGYPKSFIANNYKKYGFTSSTGLYDEFSERGTTSGGKTSLSWDQDEGIFTWDGKNYHDVNALLSEIDAAGLTDTELEALKGKFKQFGFYLS